MTEKRRAYSGPERRRDRATNARRVWTVVQVALVVVVLWTASENRKRSAEGRESHTVLCVFKARTAAEVRGLVVEVAELAAYVDAHKHGIPGLSTKAQLDRYLADRRRELADRRADVRALSRLHCPETARQPTPQRPPLVPTASTTAPSK